MLHDVFSLSPLADCFFWMLKEMKGHLFNLEGNFFPGI